MWRKMIVAVAVALAFAVTVQAAAFTYVPSDALFRMSEVAPVYFLDVRGTSAYTEEHIKGALDTPLMMLRQGKLPELDKKAMVATYCGCPHAMAEDAANLLVAAGFTNVVVLDDGFYAWKDRGYPVEKAKVTKELRRYNLEGLVADKSLAGGKIEVVEPVTGQREIATIAADGSFVLHLPYYGKAAGDELVFSAGGRTWKRPLRDATDLRLE